MIQFALVNEENFDNEIDLDKKKPPMKSDEDVEWGGKGTTHLRGTPDLTFIWVFEV